MFSAEALLFYFSYLGPLESIGIHPFGIDVYIWFEVKLHFFPICMPKISVLNTAENVFLIIDGCLIRIFLFTNAV